MGHNVESKAMGKEWIESTPTLARYLVVAQGESTSHSWVRLTPLQRDGVIGVFNAVNQQAISNDNYCPMLWLYDADEYSQLGIDDNFHAPGGKPRLLPLNKPFYNWREWVDGNCVSYAYNQHGELLKTERAQG